MNERIEHIREKLAEFDSLAERFVYESYPHDVSYLLSRIGQLQRLLDSRAVTNRTQVEIINKLERENKDLKHQLDREIETAIEYRRADEW